MVVRGEKEALLGKIASGLAHDLKHPITSIENYVELDTDVNLSTLLRESTALQTLLCVQCAHAATADRMT